MDDKEQRADAEAIASWRAAIDAWEARSDGSTSSVTGGGAIRVLEDEISCGLEGRPTLAVGSGTAALAACLIGVGVRPGDEVVTSVLDWSAAETAITWVGATCVYADIDPRTLTLCPGATARSITESTAAVVATHLFGIPADVPGIRGSLPRTVPVVEDCAQAFGARLDGRRVGTLGEAAAFSLGPGKLVDAGEGGLAVFAHDEAWDAAVMATQHRTRGLHTRQPSVGTAIPSRLHPLAAVLALAALDRADRDLAAVREAVEDLYLADPKLEFAGRDERRDPAWWRIPLLTAVRGVVELPLGLGLPQGVSPDDFPCAARAAATARLVGVAGNG